MKTVAQGDIVDTIDDYDILMIAPQIKYIETKCRDLCAKKNKPFTIISQMDYGRCNGKNILDLAQKLIDEFE